MTVQTVGAQTSPGPYGLLVAPHSAGVTVTDVATGTSRSVAVVPPVGIAGHAAWSADRQWIAISRFGRPPGERAGGSDILLIPEAGGIASPVAEHDLDGALLGAPAWMPDNSGLFYDYLPPYAAVRDSRIWYTPMDQIGHARQVGVGTWPTVSPDGRYLIYVRATGTLAFANELVLAMMDGSAERILVPADQFVQIGSPRFSPDGGEVAFIGSLTVGEALSPKVGLGDPFARSVRAHGPPGDIWVTDLHGWSTSQLTHFEEDEPTLAWSPDGGWLMMLGGGGQYLVRRDGSEGIRRLGPGGFGGIDWR
jgi:Tol biopolymer transport system component